MISQLSSKDNSAQLVHHMIDCRESEECDQWAQEALLLAMDVYERPQRTFLGQKPPLSRTQQPRHLERKQT